MAYTIPKEGRTKNSIEKSSNLHLSSYSIRNQGLIWHSHVTEPEVDKLE